MWVDHWPCSVGEGSGVAVSCGVGHRLGSDPTLLWLWLWLWCKLAATIAIQPLAWEFPYAVGFGPKKKKKRQKNLKSQIPHIVRTQLSYTLICQV